MESKHHSFIVGSCVIIFFLTSSGLFLQRANATHIFGAEITYRHISGNIYNLKAAFYRDCAGIAAPTTFEILAQSVSCGQNLTYSLPQIPGGGDEITLPCPGNSTTCVGGNTPGVQKFEYELEVALPAQCDDWIFYHNDCCRVSTTLNPSQGFYVETRLNNLSSDNNSPVFLNNPVINACVGQDYNYNNGVFDEDGDSLVIRLVPAMAAMGTPVIYNSGHSGQQPFLSTPPVSFDTVLGDYYMHPDVIEIGPVAFEISDYRNGVWMGSVLRDFSIYIPTCTNNSPFASGINGSNARIVWILPLDTFCFDIFTNDADAVNTLTLDWNQSISGATFSSNGSQHPTGTFCWAPALTDVRPQPYLFTVQVTDDNCPVNSSGIFSYLIYVTLDSMMVGLPRPASSESFSVFPNPSTRFFFFQNRKNTGPILIRNTIGEIILIENETGIDLGDHPSGIYFLEAVGTDGSIIRKKLVKENSDR